MFKKLLFLLISFLFISNSYAQVNIGFHQSNLPFIGVGYEVSEKFYPELRLGTDQFIDDISLEAVLTYKFLNKEDYDFYAGLGYRVVDYDGLVIPIGFNFYPFNKKKFGFHIEAAPIAGENGILRGSFGIRYRFLKE